MAKSKKRMRRGTCKWVNTGQGRRCQCKGKFAKKARCS